MIIEGQPPTDQMVLLLGLYRQSILCFDQSVEAVEAVLLCTSWSKCGTHAAGGMFTTVHTLL